MECQESQTEVNVLSLLAEAAEWTDEETLQNLSKTLPIVNDFLRMTPSPENGLQVTRFAFGSFLPHLEVDKNAFDFFDAAVPCLKTAFDEFLQDCKRKAKENVDQVNELLQQCILVVECSNLAMQFLLQAERITIENVRNLPQIVQYIINLSLDHCKDSEHTYGSHLQLVKDSLFTLFRLTVELSTQFAHILSKLTFDSFSEDDMEILLGVCEQLCATASSLSQLSEIRGCVVVWRAYTSLVNQHCGNLITRMDLRTPLVALTEEIRDGLLLLASIPVKNATMDEKDQKVVQRIIKMSSFCLKVIIALCEKFQGYLRGAHSALVSLLLLLFRFSPENMTLQNYPSIVKKGIEQQVIFGIAPLLIHLRDDEEFIKMVLEIGEDETRIDIEWGSYLQLLIAVCVPHNTVTMMHTCSFLTRIFQTMEKSHASLSFPCMMNGVMFGGRPQSNVTLYEHVLTHVCALVGTLEAIHFEILEQLLVEWLLSGKTWPALLSADIWCFVARYGSSELCKCHCLVLIDLLSCIPPPSHQHLVTASLLSRLIPKLCLNHKQEVFSNFKCVGHSIPAWYSIMQGEANDSVEELTRDVLQACTEKVNVSLSRKATEQTIVSLLDELEYLTPLFLVFTCARNAAAPFVEDFTKALLQLWIRIPVDHIGCSVVDLMISSLLKATTSVLSCFSNNQLLQIISSCEDCCTKGSAVVWVSVCDLLATLGRCHLSQSSELSSILCLISNELSLMLSSPNPLVYQCALDAFVAFGQHTAHEEVLSVCLERCEEGLQERVTNYLQQEPHVLLYGQSRNILLQNQNITCSFSYKPKLQKDFKPIEDLISPNNKCHDMLVEKERPSKRCREDEDSSPEKPTNIKSLLDSLYDSFGVMKKIKDCNIMMEETEIDRVKDLLQEMVCTWEMKAK
ncbi:FIGNL1-interacting regulator of recombination and mitosis-like isoform X2 [Panulirus ornatus]|uniref:FIGNL1-interacting regulator of recombination and mitosis-like isoform X2 n=1 Tax=Panulirus ornatus TaxID=150431 RepID=UPI003A877565